MLKHIRAVLFDLDGTLIDSAPDLGAAADKMRLDRGLSSLPYALYRPLAGAGARGMLKIAFDMTPEHADFMAMREEFFANYEAAMTVKTYVFDGVQDLIAGLQARDLPWGVVTNKMARFTDPLTQAMPLFASASAIVSGDTTPHPKPHPEPMFEAARRLGLAPELCLYVGDDERDIVAGRAAGMRTVAANYGYLGEKTDISSWGADLKIDSPIQLLQLLG
ncbi:HAD-IA family hydrolase [Limnohabitans sp.]|uniref:HAD-IA family hydrolase n=1 Tax=Limnohabitans sp. TaxID=1907725 RepID=UPI00286F220F|nr:HAD-IA family hydrolase [Limnohabitans sp.]